MDQPQVAVLMGSRSDWEVMQHCCTQLKALGLAFEAHVISAHRTPEDLDQYVTSAQRRGISVFIAAAGMSAALAGTVAARTVLPVIGVPLDSGTLGGIDALLSTVQMPPGVPVATVAIGTAGARNAAVLAGQILALGDASLADRLGRLKEEQAEAVRHHNRELHEQHGLS